MEGGAISMSSIDDRVVNMQFNNAQFQKGVEQTNQSLADLKSNLKLDGATDGIDQVQGAANRFSLSNMESALTNISSHFSIFGAAAFTVVQSLTNSAIDAGKQIAGSLIDPLVQGGAKRALALQQAQFQFRGLGLDIQATMDAALAAVKGTAFGLDDAATAAAQFGASGITAGNGLETVLRSVAGVAAQTGSSYANVANIFETIAGNGRIMGEQLNQLSSYGVNAAAVLAKSLGTTESNVRDLVTQGKISFTQFSDAMNAAFGANAAKANETYSGALDNMHAALARIGADVASPYFLGMRDIFNELGPVFDTIHTAIQPLLNDFASFQTDSSANVVKGIQNLMGSGLLGAIENIVTAVKVLGLAFQNAFKRIFPDDTTAQLSAIGRFLDQITAALIPGTVAFLQLQRVLEGVFAIFDILGRVIGAAINEFAQLFGFTFQGSGSFLEFAASIGDWLVKVDDAVKKGTVLQDIFRVLGSVLAIPIGLIKGFVAIIGALVTAFTNINTGGFDNFADDVSKKFEGLNQLAQFFQDFWNGVVVVAKAVWGFLKPIFAAIGGAIGQAVQNIKDAFSNLSFDDGLQAINTGLFGAFILIVKGFFGNLGGVLQGNGLAIVSSFKKIFGQLQLNLKALEVNTNAKTLTQIAIAVALLAASAVALSLVDAANLAKAMAAIGGLMASLIGTFAAFEKIGGTKGVLQALTLAVAVEAIAGAILVLAAAIAILGAIPLANLAQGVIALAVVLGILIGALALLNKMGPKVAISAAAIAILAPALAVLAGVIAILGALPFDNLVQGMAGFAAMLLVLIGALALLNLMGPKVLISAAAIAILAPAIATLAGAIAILGALPLANLEQGMIAFAVTMGVMVGALALLNLLGPEVLLGAVAIGIVALSLGLLVGSVALLGALPMDNLIQGLVALAAVMAIMVGAILLLGLAAPEALLGAAALVAVALAFGVLAPAVALLGTMSWDDIGRAMAVLGASIAILAVGGVLLIPASVGFLLLGAAILLIGEGVFLAATGVALLAAAIAALMVVGAGGLLLLGGAIDVFISKLPALGFAFGAAIVDMIVAIGASAGQLIAAFVQLILAMLAAIDQTVPALVNTAVLIIITLVNALVVLIPFLVNAGLQMLTGILTGIANNIGGIVEQGSNIIINFLNAIAAKLPDIINAAGNVALSFINGLGDYVRNNSGKFVTAGSQLFRAVVDGISAAIAQGGSDIRYAGSKIGNALLQGAKNALGINSPSKKFRDDVMPSVFEGIEKGNDKNLNRAENAGSAIGDSLANNAISSVKKAISTVSDVMSNANLNTSPTIRPVMDLTDIKNGAQQIPGLMPKPSLALDTSNNVATSVSLQDQAKNAQLVIDASKPAPGPVINYSQTNNSPKALTTSEIYRNTKNQLSTLKGELGVVDQSGSTQ